MKITAENPILDRIIHNKLSLDHFAGYVRPVRFTDSQLALYESLQGNFKVNSLCTSGVDIITKRTAWIAGFRTALI